MKHELITQAAREIGEIEALKAALEKREHWLRQAEDWRAHKARNPATAHQATRFHLNALKQADYYQPEVLRAAYRLFEIEGLWEAYLDASHQAGITEPDEPLALHMTRVTGGMARG